MNRQRFSAFAIVLIAFSSSVVFATTVQVRRCDQLFVPASQQDFKPPVKTAALPASYTKAALEFLRVLEVNSEPVLKRLTSPGREVTPEHNAQLRTLAQLAQAYQTSIGPVFRAMNDNAILRLQEDSEEMRKMIDDDQVSLQTQINSQLGKLRSQFVELLQPGGNTAIIEIGPSRAGAFHEDDLKDLVGMYQRYSEKKGWIVSILDSEHVDHALRTITLKIEGPGSYRLLSFDRGDHRFIELGDHRANAGAGKRYTRYAQVKVYRPPQPREFRVKMDDFAFKATRSSGPGGQHVNKTDSAVHATHTPTGLTVKVMTERSQQENKRIAVELLTARLFAAFRDKQEKDLKGARAEGKVNHFVEESAGRWTRTYDWSTDAAGTKRIFGGDLDPVLGPFQAAALELQMRKFTQAIEAGKLELLHTP